MSRRLVVVALSLACGAAGCAALRPVTASSGDLADYRAFRVAAADGTRLARAKQYLERHPQGAFADEVRGAWDAEEPRYFAKAQSSREYARRYLVDLPDGPHAAAAMAMLVALQSTMDDAELTDIARKAQRDDVKLEAAAVQRRAVGEAILGAIGVLLDEEVYAARQSEGPPALRALMSGGHGTTWGAATAEHEEDHFFLLPTRPVRESRLVTMKVSLTEEEGRVVAAAVSGPDLFVRWAEADRIVRLDPAAPEDRTEAQIHVQERLVGALERRFPASHCPDARGDRELYHRACDGWEARVTAGTAAGESDVIVIRGPGGPARKLGVR
ncbi:MAG: hypothetical protein JWP97_4794 [Labilithrix sp.]|nr:hypothetical protein [Labilithrix sp.]